MAHETFQEEKEILEAGNYLPSVSIILPFEPKMSGKTELEYQLKRVIEKVERELAKNYVDEKTRLVTDRLKQLVRMLDYSTYKRSLAIFVSPLLEKVFYLDIPVEEKIIIDESFEIRDLVYSKKEIHKYLIVVLSGQRSRIYLGNTTQFVRLSSTTPESIGVYKNDVPERIANFSDPSERKEVLLDKFLHHTDSGLGIILNAYQLPLFVMGTERTVGHFKKISHHTNSITSLVHGNFDEASDAAIRTAIAPHVADWKKVKQNDLLHRLDAAKGAKKLASGIRKVWQEASKKKGRLLVVEKNYQCAARLQKNGQDILPKDAITDTPFYIKDAVDDIIEKVLKNGGDVEFVDEGLLENYQHIALIQYYR
jgi:hypothetical protein